jgi:hypothetical protein
VDNEIRLEILRNPDLSSLGDEKEFTQAIRERMNVLRDTIEKDKNELEGVKLEIKKALVGIHAQQKEWMPIASPSVPTGQAAPGKHNEYPPSLLQHTVLSPVPNLEDDHRKQSSPSFETQQPGHEFVHPLSTQPHLAATEHPSVDVKAPKPTPSPTLKRSQVFTWPPQ